MGVDAFGNNGNYFQYFIAFCELRPIASQFRN